MIPSQPAIIHQPTPQRPIMVSTGTMTSPSPSPAPKKYPDMNKRPVHRFPPADFTPHHHRTLSQPQPPENPRSSAPTLGAGYSLPQRPSILDVDGPKYKTGNLIMPKS